MGAVAVERGTIPERDIDRVDDRSAAGPRVPASLERLLLRYVAWGTQHPHNVLARTQHRLVTTGFRLGYGRFDDDMVLTTIGRISGHPRHVIVSALLIDERLYVVNPFGDRAHWYRNLLVDPIATLQRRNRMWTARATRVVEHDEAVMLYQRTPGSIRTMLRLFLRAEGLGETAEDFAANIDRFCFVRFDPVDEPGPPPMPADLAWVWPVAGAVGLVGLLARRRLRIALASAVLAVPTLVGTALAWNRAYARIEQLGTHPEGRWARLFSWVGPRLTWWLYEAFENALDVQPEDDVLDVACGCGTFLRTRCAGAHRIAGLDHSVSLIDIARRENQERLVAGTAEFAVGDVTSLPWEEGTFSVVTSNDVGCYEEKAQAAIAEMYRVLRSGGRAVLADDRHEQMEAAGFAEVKVEPFHRLGYITRGIKP
jgi:deazaflavin-dependent oxidoreductase (nitroreductase family)